jgi:hypothetical protein
VPPHDLVQRSFQQRHIRLDCEGNRKELVVQAVPGRELIQKPKALLSEG